MSDGFTFEARFDGIRLDVLRTSVSGAGRDVVQHTSPNRDGADLEDQAKTPRSISCDLIFLDHRFTEPGEGDYLDRFEAFERLAGSGETRIFLHPYMGSINCKIGPFSHDADGETGPVINASVTFLEDLARPPAFTAGVGLRSQAASADVSNFGTALDALLDTPSEVAALAIAAADDWETNPARTVRQIQLEAASLSSDLSDEMATRQIGESLETHEQQKAYTIFAASIRNLSEALSSTTRRIFTLETTEPLPLRIIAARIYGARQSEDRLIEMRDLNPNIPIQSLIPAATILKAYSPAVGVGTIDPR